MNEYWEGRGFPWEYDSGPAKNRSWARLFAETPNYRGLGVAVLGKEKFRWHFGPMFYRGRLGDGQVKVLVIGQEGAQDESLAYRAFTGGTGARMQHFLNYLGISKSYLFLNTFVYPIFGQYGGGKLRWLAQDPDSPIVQHRHKIYNYVLQRNDVHLIIAVGNAAKESVVSWVESRGGNCPSGALDVSQCSGASLDPFTRLIGVVHPGGAGQGGSLNAIKADFLRAADQIRQWIEADPGWLPVDTDGQRDFNQPYTYESDPIPFRDFPYGTAWRLGRGGTSSNRKDDQRSIQIFSADGSYNNLGDSLEYSDLALGDSAGYAAAAGDVPYEPPKGNYLDYDRGPGSKFARLLMGGQPGLEWPDFKLLGANAHLSFGTGPIYRGRPEAAFVLILADQQSHDDLFTGRALTGEAGQRMQVFLQAIGIDKSYLILRTLPVDTLDLSASQVHAIVDNSQVRALYQAIVDRVRLENDQLGLILTFGEHADRLAQNLNLAGIPRVALKAWNDAGALADWQAHLADIQQVNYAKDLSAPSFQYDGSRGQIPRIDLPYGVRRWVGTSGSRARQPVDLVTNTPSPNYYKLILPDWVFDLVPEPLSPAEQAAIQNIP